VARIFSLIGTVLFAGSMVYFWSWYVGPFGGPASGVRPAEAGGVWPAVAWNLATFSLFALHHSILARSGLKAAVSRLVSANLERPLYIWVSSVLFFLVCWTWQDVPGVVWSAGTWWPLLFGLQLSGVALSAMAARRLSLLDFAGFRGAKQTGQPAAVVTDGLYRFVRHPLYFAWMLIVWPTPEMTGTRLVFATISSLYLVIAIPFEERDLVRTLGAPYEQYCRQSPWKVIPFVY
jgi:protein-S-isoprenylcysteine O-methyltransferase Ste14